MTRSLRKAVSFRRMARLLLVPLFALLLADDLLTASMPDLSSWNGPIGGSTVESSDGDASDGSAAIQDWSVQARRPVQRVPQRDATPSRGPTRELLGLRPVHPPVGSRLDYCAEFTKPDSLKIRLTGTPKSHRSPPAPIGI
jgi:hypothetical protein